MRKIVFISTLLFISVLGIAQEGSKQLWGIAGDNTIYKTDTSLSKLERVYDFKLNDGEYPEKGKFVEATNGKLYALSTGRFNGAIIEFDPKTEEQRIISDFFRLRYGSTSYRPQGSLIQASNEKLYGVTSSGGFSGFNGILFSYDIEKDTVVPLHSLGQQNIKSPEGDLFEASNGKLYGLSPSGGANGRGTIFEYDITLDTIIRIHDFNTTNGSTPKGSLIQVGNNLIGMTTFGGVDNHGVIFEYNLTSSSYTKLHDLDSVNSGRHPSGSLVEADNGLLYGMTVRGGTTDEGVVFEFDLSNNTARKIIDLDSAAYGDSPEGDLMQADNGLLYGMCRDGGFKNDGTLLQIDPTNDSVTVLFEFGDENGQFPRGSVIQASNGILYGMTLEGGVSDQGTIFKYNTQINTYSRLIDFNWYSSGFFPTSKLIQAKDGLLYGVTGGAAGLNNAGTIFRLNPFQEIAANKNYPFSPHEFQKLHDFDTLNGRVGYGLMVEVETGVLIGSTSRGGINDQGTLFRYDYLSDNFQKLYDFDENNLGQIPNGDLIVAENGKVYSTLEQGGANKRGSIFEFDIQSNTVVNVAELDSINGSRFDFGVMQASDGFIYGVATFGGDSNQGTIVRLDLSTNTLSKVHDFSDSTGTAQEGVLFEASDGFLYGVSREGGRFDKGTLYQFDMLKDSVVVVHHFVGATGEGPNGQLTELNGKLYGVCREGGTGGFPVNGVIFEYDLARDILIELVQFDPRKGIERNPRLGVTVVDTCHQAFYTGIGTTLGEICENDTTGLVLGDHASLNAASQWELLQNSKSTNIVSTTTSGEFRFQVDSSSIYYIRAVGGCVGNKIVDSISIVVNGTDTTIDIVDPVLSSNDILATYQWLDCDSNYAVISGETNRSFTATKNGFYAVELTYKGCVDTSYCKQIVSIGIEEVSFEQKVSISPNPSSGDITIQLSENVGKMSLKLYSASGQLVLASNYRNQNRIELSFDGEKGIYFLELMNEEGERANIKVVKQ